ncbi:actin-like protein 8 [Ochotona curzoniae]|uniref:actin-like protein 8 n=1 Tax=Ochotona curzoniae TaxID=130825 RepID=UPI001B349D48|nr:actin-like protein 8 [Ochotona curzoniae]
MAEQAIIIDHGSGFLKSGLSGWNEPQMVFPSVVNYIPCQENPGPSSARRKVVLGFDFNHPKSFSYPIERGHIVNWEGVEQLWSFVLDKHREKHQDAPVIVTQNPLWEPADRHHTLEVMFELLDVPSLLLANQMEMSLYSSGLMTGVVLDSGYGLTRVQSFHQGCPFAASGKTLKFAGQDLIAYLFKGLFTEDYNSCNLFQLETVTNTQTSKCYVPQNLAEELNLRQSMPSGISESNVCLLPNGRPVELTPMQLMAPEMFFSPQLFDLPGPSFSKAIIESVKTCEDSLQQPVLSHVVTCGGNTLYPGFIQRLYRELLEHFLFPKTTMWENVNRNFSVWLGASVVAHLSSYKSEWITREEYDEAIRS